MYTKPQDRWIIVSCHANLRQCYIYILNYKFHSLDGNVHLLFMMVKHMPKSYHKADMIEKVKGVNTAKAHYGDGNLTYALFVRMHLVET